MNYKTMSPKKLYVRQLKDGKISVGEYIRAKWNNVVDPFDCEDAESVRNLNQSIAFYKRQTKRDVEIVPYAGTEALHLLIDAIKKYCH